MAHVPPELQAHKEWLGQIQQVGLVVSPNVLVRQGVFIDRQKSVEKQERLRELIDSEDNDTLRVINWRSVCRDILEWPDILLAGVEGGPALPNSLTVALPEYEDNRPNCGCLHGCHCYGLAVERRELDLDCLPVRVDVNDSADVADFEALSRHWLGQNDSIVLLDHLEWAMVGVGCDRSTGFKSEISA